MSAKLPPVLIVGIVMMMMVSCSKKGSKPPAAPPMDSTGMTTPGGGTTGNTTDVYVCGADDGKPCYWKNGTEVILPASPSGEARSITVHDTDLYVAGHVGTYAVYWKNGTAISLQPTTAGGVFSTNAYWATAIAFADSDLYVAIDQQVANNYVGKDDFYEVIQPSGFATEHGVTDPLNGPTLNSIFVSGSDVYCAGAGIQGAGTSGGINVVAQLAAYYKNGEEFDLSSTPDLNPVEDFVAGVATGIAVSGSDVYVCGSQAPGQFNSFTNDNAAYPIYWKNNVGQALPGPNGGVTGATSSLVLSGSDVYISGYINFNDQNYSAVYWKNGTLTLCGNSPSYGQSIGVSSSGDVYVAGYQYDPTSGDPTAVLWKNGAQTTLGAANTTIAYGVFVYTH